MERFSKLIKGINVITRKIKEIRKRSSLKLNQAQQEQLIEQLQQQQQQQQQVQQKKNQIQQQQQQIYAGQQNPSAFDSNLESYEKPIDFLQHSKKLTQIIEGNDNQTSLLEERIKQNLCSSIQSQNNNYFEDQDINNMFQNQNNQINNGDLFAIGEIDGSQEEDSVATESVKNENGSNKKVNQNKRNSQQQQQQQKQKNVQFGSCRQIIVENSDQQQSQQQSSQNELKKTDSGVLQNGNSPPNKQQSLTPTPQGNNSGNNNQDGQNSMQNQYFFKASSGTFKDQSQQQSSDQKDNTENSNKPNNSYSNNTDLANYNNINNTSNNNNQDGNNNNNNNNNESIDHDQINQSNNLDEEGKSLGQNPDEEEEVLSKLSEEQIKSEENEEQHQPRLRHIHKIKFLIYPDDPFKQGWNIMLCLLLIYTGIVTPYRICFQQTDDELSWFILDLLIDIIFGLDMLLSFVSAYQTEEDEVLIVSYKQIIVNYLTGWFILDILAVFPFQYVFESDIGQYNNLVRLGRLPRLYKVVRMTKLMRMFKMLKERNRLIRYITYFLRVGATVERLLTSLISLIFFCHVACCFWYLAGVLNEDGKNWISTYQVDQMDQYEAYVNSFYWTVTTLVTVGYGDIVAQNTTERIISCVYMFVGVFFYSFTIGTLSSLLNELDTKEASFDEKLNVLSQIKHKYALDNILFVRIKKAIKYGHYKTDQQKNQFLADLPLNLRTELSVIMYKDLIHGIEFFKNKPDRLIAFIGPLLKPIRVGKDEYIFTEGEYANEMYFIKQGQVSIVLREYNNFPFMTITQGYYFGEVDMLFGDIRKHTYVADQECELLSLTKKHFTKIFFYDFRELGSFFYKNALKRRIRSHKLYKEAQDYCKKEIESQKMQKLQQNSGANSNGVSGALTTQSAPVLQQGKTSTSSIGSLPPLKKFQHQFSMGTEKGEMGFQMNDISDQDLKESLETPKFFTNEKVNDFMNYEEDFNQIKKKQDQKSSIEQNSSQNSSYLNGENQSMTDQLNDSNYQKTQLNNKNDNNQNNKNLGDDPYQQQYFQTQITNQTDRELHNKSDNKNNNEIGKISDFADTNVSHTQPSQSSQKTNLLSKMLASKQGQKQLNINQNINNLMKEQSICSQQSMEDQDFTINNLREMNQQILDTQQQQQKSKIPECLANMFRKALEKNKEQIGQSNLKNEQKQIKELENEVNSKMNKMEKQVEEIFSNFEEMGISVNKQKSDQSNDNNNNNKMWKSETNMKGTGDSQSDNQINNNQLINQYNSESAIGLNGKGDLNQKKGNQLKKIKNVLALSKKQDKN